ncbi:MAG: thiol-activated cytolysin family protein, partial [Flavobacterium sp.]
MKTQASSQTNQQHIFIIRKKNYEKRGLNIKIKNLIKKITSFLAIGAMLTLSLRCKKEDVNSTRSICDASIPTAGTAIPFTILSDSIEDVNCRTKLVEFGPEWKEFISLDPQGSVIWPGGDLLYSSIRSGGYTPVSSDRKPITISVSLPGIAGNPGRTLEHPTLSTARSAMNEILQQLVQGSATPAQIAWSQTQIYNERHFKLAVGGNYGNLFMDINAQFNYNSSSVMGRFLFQFTQVYYSVDCDAPNAGIENFFNNTPSCNQLGGYSPCYVSSVKYGRKVFLMIESNQYDYSAMADIRASFDAFFSS